MRPLIDKNGRTLKKHWNSEERPFCGYNSHTTAGYSPILTTNPDYVTCKSCLNKVKGQAFHNYNSALKKNGRLTKRELKEYKLPDPSEKNIRKAEAAGARLNQEYNNRLDRTLGLT